MNTTIFIPGNVPSSKNSKQWTGKYFIHSKSCQEYYKNTDSFWKMEAVNFRNSIKDLPKPLKIEFEFIRKSKHKFDLINPCQTIQDLMVKYGWIDDDNADEIIPYFKPYSYDKENPGVYIKIL